MADLGWRVRQKIEQGFEPDGSTLTCLAEPYGPTDLSEVDGLGQENPKCHSLLAVSCKIDRTSP
jgi:hypothetical protein